MKVRRHWSALIPFNASATVRAYRRAFWELLECEQPEDLPNKVPHHIRLKDQNRLYERANRYKTEAAT